MVHMMSTALNAFPANWLCHIYCSINPTRVHIQHSTAPSSSHHVLAEYLDNHNSFLHELNSPTLLTFTHGLRQLLGDSRTQTQDTSGLEMFLPSPGVSHLFDIQHAFSGGDSSLNPGSGCTFNSTTLPYGSNSTENFDFNFSFDPNLLNFDQNNGGRSHGLMLPDIPNSPSPLPPTSPL